MRAGERGSRGAAVPELSRIRSRRGFGFDFDAHTQLVGVEVKDVAERFHLSRLELPIQ